MINWPLVTFAALAVLGTAIAVVRLSFSYSATGTSADLTMDDGRWTIVGASRSIVHRPSSIVHRPQARDLPPILAHYELPILALLAPFMLFASPVTVLALAVVPALWCARWRTRGYLLPRTPLDWPLVLMMVMLPVSLLVSVDIGFSLGKAALLIYGVAIYYAIVDWARTFRRLYWVLGVYFIAGGLIALLALLGTNWQSKVPVLGDIVHNLPQVTQIFSRDQTGFHPNIVAGALLWVVLPLMALVAVAWSAKGRQLYRNRTWRVGMLILLLLTAGTLLLTQSRLALLSLLVGVGFLLWLALPRLRIALIALPVLAVVFIAIAGPEQIIGSADTDTSQGTAITDSITVRVQVWQSALHAISDNPLTGMGLDNFRRLMPFRYPAAAVPDSYDIGHAHNQLLQAAVDLGLPGLVGYLALWIGAALLAARSYMASKDPWRRALAAGIGAALLASFLHGLTDVVALISKPGILFWGLLAIDSALWLRVRAGASGMVSVDDEQSMPTLGEAIAITRAWWRGSAIPVLHALYLAVLALLPVGLVTLLAGGLRFYRLDALSLWIAEGDSVTFARLPWQGLLGLEPANNWHLQLYYLLVKLATTLGLSELIAGRLVSALAGTLTVTLLYFLVARLAGKWIALAASLVLAIAPLHIWYSQDAQPYALAALLVCASYLCLVAFYESGKWAWAVAYGAVVLLAVQTEYSAVYAILPQVVLFVVIFREHRRHIMPLLIALAATALLSLPWLLGALAIASGVSQAEYVEIPGKIGTALLAVTGLGMSAFTGGTIPSPWNVWSDPGMQVLMVLITIPALVLGAIALARRSLLSIAVPACLLIGTLLVAAIAALFILASVENAAIYAQLGWASLIGAAPFVVTERRPRTVDGIQAGGGRWSVVGRRSSVVVAALSLFFFLLMSSWTAYANYSSADKQHWRDFADDVAKVSAFGWPVLTYPVKNPVTASLLDTYKPGVLDWSHISISATNELPAEIGPNGMDAVWLASVQGPGLSDVDKRFRQAGYHLVTYGGEWYNLLLDLYVRDGARLGIDIPVNGGFKGTGDAANGWWMSSSGATYSLTEGGGRQLNLTNDKETTLVAGQDITAKPDHLYLLNFETRLVSPSGVAKAFLICSGTNGEWLQVAPYWQQDTISAGAEWQKAGVATLCPAGTTHLTIHLRNSGKGEVDYRNVSLQDIPRWPVLNKPTVDSGR